MIKENLMLNLIIVLIASFLGGVISRKLRLPLIAGYLLSGMAVSLLNLANFSASSGIRSIAEIGVALLLFTLGLEFSIQKIKDHGEIIMFSSFIQILATIFLSIIILPFLGFDFYSSIFMGSIFSLSSTAVVVKMLSDRGELETLPGEISSGWLFMQDLYTFPMIIILPAIYQVIYQPQIGLVSLLIIGKSIIVSFGLFFLVIYLGKKIIPSLIEKIADLKSREILVIASITICLLFSYTFYQTGFPYAIGAFIAGVILSSSSAHYSIFAEIRPLKDLFSAVFFVTLGMMLRWELLFSNLPLIVTLVLLVVLLKFLVSNILILLLGFHTKTAFLVSVSLISVGEFAFILTSSAFSNSLISQQLYLIILSVSFISLIVAVPLIEHSEALYYALKGIIIKRVFWGKNFFHHFDNSGKVDQESLTDHVIVLGYGRVGKYVCFALELANIPFVVVDYNHHLIKKLRSQGIKVIYGDPVDIDVLRFAEIMDAKVLIMAFDDRGMQDVIITNALTLNSSLKFVARVHHEEDQKKLKSLGVDIIVQPEFEAAIQITKKLLQVFKKDRDDIDNKIRQVKLEYGLI